MAEQNRVTTTRDQDAQVEIEAPTYTQLGEYLKQTAESEGVTKYRDVDSRSLGLRYHKRYAPTQKITITEEDVPIFAPFIPDEGFSALGTAQNIPESAVEEGKNILTALSSPYTTGKTMVQAGIGAVEGLAGTNIFPESKQVAREMKEGVLADVGFTRRPDGTLDFTGEGLQNRPLAAISTLLGGTGLGANIAKRTAAQVAKQAGKRGADQVREGAERFVRGAEKVEKASQLFDPTTAIGRGMLKGAELSGKAALGGIKQVGKEVVVKPIAKAYQGSQAQQTFKNFQEAITGFKEFAQSGFDGRFANIFGRKGQTIRERGRSALESIKDLNKKAEEFVTEQVGQRTMDQVGPVKTKGLLDGLVAQFMGFTTGLGSDVIDEIVRISRIDDQAQRKIMLEAANREYDTGSRYVTVGDEIISELTGAVNEWSEKMREGTLDTRQALQMNKVKTNMPSIRQAIIQDPNLRNQGVVFEFGTVKDDIGYGAVGGRVFKERPATPEEKGFKPDNINFGGTDIPAMGQGVAAVKEAFEYVMNLPENASIAELDLAKRRISKLQKASEGQAQSQLNTLRGIVYDAIVKRYDAQDVRQQLGVSGTGPNPYLAAMAEYEDYVTRLDDIEATLGVKDPQLKFGGEETLAVLRQSKNPQTVIKAVLNAFGGADREIALRNLRVLLDDTGRQDLLPKIVGLSMRPIFGEGLVVKSEISQIGRAALSYNLFNVLTAPLVLAGFSPKYGGMALSYLYSPSGAAELSSLPGKGVDLATQGVGRLEQILSAGNVPLLNKLSAERTGKSIDKITPADRAKTLTEVRTMREILEQSVGSQEITTLKSLLRGGVATNRAVEQGQEEETRRNILATLSRAGRFENPTTPPPTGGGSTLPPSR
tara:strand:+ start:2537 stop:5176 length:2640 start_codon:yes stop_codon:yes gene_type:complete